MLHKNNSFVVKKQQFKTQFTINIEVNYYMEIFMVTKKVTTRRKPVEPISPPTKNFSTAALGLGMVVLTNYQAEVKQVLSLILKTLT